MHKMRKIAIALFMILLATILLFIALQTSAASNCHSFSDSELEKYGKNTVKKIVGGVENQNKNAGLAESINPKSLIELAKYDLGCESNVDFAEINAEIGKIANKKVADKKAENDTASNDLVSFPAEIIILSAIIVFAVGFIIKMNNIDKH